MQLHPSFPVDIVCVLTIIKSRGCIVFVELWPLFWQVKNMLTVGMNRAQPVRY